MRYLVIHSVPAGLSIEDIRKGMESSQTDPDVHGIHSYMNLSLGKAVCVLEAVSREKLVEFLRRVNLPFDEILEVEVEGSHGHLTDLRAEAAIGV